MGLVLVDILGFHCFQLIVFGHDNTRNSRIFERGFLKSVMELFLLFLAFLKLGIKIEYLAFVARSLVLEFVGHVPGGLEVFL